MLLADPIFLTICIFLVFQLVFPKKEEEKKTPEEELGEAIAKYLKTTNPSQDSSQD